MRKSSAKHSIMVAGGASRGAVGNGPDSNTGLSTYNVLASQADYLTVSVMTEAPGDVVVYLSELLRLSEGAPEETCLEFAGEPLYVKARSRTSPLSLHAEGWFDWRVLAVQGAMVEAQITLYSAALWAYGLAEAVRLLQEWADAFYGQSVTLIPARLDLCRDISGWSVPNAEGLQAFSDALVSRSRAISSAYRKRQGRLCGETIYIGAPGGACRLTIYDKLAELARSKKTYYMAEWLRNGYSVGDSVTRFEWRLGRQFLREWVASDKRAMASIQDLLSNVPAIWDYLMRKQTRHISVSSSDSNRWRAPLSALWSVVASPFRPGEEGDVESGSRFRRTAPDRDRLELQLFGCLRSRLALTPGGEDVDRDELSRGFLLMYDRWLASQGCSLSELVMSRRAERMAA